jgi:putative PIN family toxin of toxin-antitoxin system
MNTAKRSTAESGSLRVVLDTNVYISAFTHPQGRLFRLWSLAALRRYHLLVSRAIITEIAGVLRKTFSWPEHEVLWHVKLVARTAEIITPSITLAVFTGPMEPDNRILECAVAGRADLIVSGDRDLQRLKAYEKISIIRPIDALRTLDG